MSIEAGERYKITNAKGGTALDLSSDDEQTIAGWDWHGGDNQIARFLCPPSRPRILSNVSGVSSGSSLPTAESGILRAPRLTSSLPSRRENLAMASALLAPMNPSVGTSGLTQKTRAFIGMLSGVVWLA